MRPLGPSISLRAQSLELPMLLPGVKASTSSTDFYSLQRCEWRGSKAATWHLFEEVISNESAVRPRRPNSQPLLNGVGAISRFVVDARAGGVLDRGRFPTGRT